MRNLILLIVRYGSFLLFVVLEIICFLLIINFNQSQKDIWLNSANLFSGKINERTQMFNDYLSLKTVNDSLLNENAKLLQSIINFRIYDAENNFLQFEQDLDSIDYNLIPAFINDRTIHLRNNYLTINKGSNDGVEAGMGVISTNGIVGIVSQTTTNYSKVVLVLHSQSRISALVQSKEYAGTMKWISRDPRNLTLEHIPKYAEIEIGDTIVTSGYSTAFPRGVEIGYVSNFKQAVGSDNLIIDVELAEDISKLAFVYVVDFKLVEEKSELEEIEIEQ